MTVGDRCSVVIQLCIYLFTQAFNLLTDVGIFVDSSKILPDCDKIINSNFTNEADESVRCSGGDNFTSTALENSKTDLRILQITIAAFFLLGGFLFLTQLFMYFKYFVASGSPSFEHDIDDSLFLKHFYKIHGIILALEAILHDVPLGFIVIELSALVWEQPNCWECVAIFSSDTPDEVSLSKTNLWLGIKLASLVPITFYKGMFPMFMWIGGPFCGMDCYICRVCTVIPCGFLATVLLMTPLCGAILNRLVPIASGIDEGIANTVWSIGLIFWAITILVVTFLCVCCVPACRRCCFRYGPCKWCGLDCCGLGEKPRETIKKDEAEA